MAYKIQFAESVETHLETLTAGQQARVFRAIEAHVKTIKLSQASRPLADYAAELGDEIMVLTDRDRPVAAIVPLRRADQESLALSNHPEFLGIIAQSRADVRAGRTVSLTSMKRRFQPLQSPDRRLQPTKARRTAVVKSGARKRLRG